MQPCGLKEPIKNESRLEHGNHIIIAGTPRFASRDVTIAMNLTAPDEATWLLRYYDFCNEIAKGKITIRTNRQEDVYYRFIYVSPPSQYSQYMCEMASFTLKLTEPDPSNRTATDNGTILVVQ
jgi:hypothetical protein